MATNGILIACRDKSKASQTYLSALRRTGWIGPVHLLAPGDPVPDLGNCSGLLLAGGLDIHPKAWDPAEPLHPLAEPDEDRDALEIPLVQTAWERRLPILGICRGEQLFNVALGGSLIQDVPEHFGCPADLHRHGDSTIPDLRHSVEIDPPSRLASILGSGPLPVNSRHHQAVHRVAPELRAVAWHRETSHSRSGPLIEAVEAMDPSRWAFGVQWHPENLVGLDGPAGEGARAIFQAFLETASLLT